MIKLNHITIAFDQVLMENTELKILPGLLTVIQGESGSGKSSLLYLVGLLKKDKNLEYYFNDTLIHLNNEQLIADIRKNKIGYVFQDNSLIDHLSIYENIALYGQMVGKKVTVQEAEALIGRVALDKDIHQTITTLSGGEKQRLAIACAIFKQPDLLILDEPTSALDKKNALLIMDILKELASCKMMILLTSHDQMIVDLCDVVYQVKDKKLVTCESMLLKDDVAFTLQKVSLPISFYFSYFKNYLKSNLLIYIALFMIVGFSISVLTGYQNIGTAFEEKQQELLDDIGNTEIFVTSEKNDYGEAKYHTNLPTISDTIIKHIQDSQYTDEFYPFYEGYFTEATINGKTISFSSAVHPYTKHKNLDHFLDLQGDDLDGVYLSSQVANSLNISDISNMHMSFELFLPDGSSVKMNDLKISGVLKKNVPNNYSGASMVIYIPYELMPQYNEVQALMVYATHFDTVSNLKSMIDDNYPNLGTFNQITRVGNLKSSFESIQTITPFLLIILLLITISLIVITYMRYIGNRRNEICLLKVNGLSKQEIIKLIIIELLIQALCITTFATLSTLLLYQLLSILLQLEIIFELNSLLTNLLTSILFILVPSLVSLFVYQKADPAIMLRDDL